MTEADDHYDPEAWVNQKTPGQAYLEANRGEPQSGPYVKSQKTPLTEAERKLLQEAVHHRNMFDYDECDHGTYLGGPYNGQPYAMCERVAGKDSGVVHVVEKILKGRQIDAPSVLESFEVQWVIEYTTLDGTREAIAVPEEKARELYEFHCRVLPDLDSVLKSRVVGPWRVEL